MASISLRGVQKAYGDGAPVIRDVDLDIAENEFCVFLGPSGCGKSTLAADDRRAGGRQRRRPVDRRRAS